REEVGKIRCRGGKARLPASAWRGVAVALGFRVTVRNRIQRRSGAGSVTSCHARATRQARPVKKHPTPNIQRPTPSPPFAEWRGGIGRGGAPKSPESSGTIPRAYATGIVPDR